ncbi:hypothetical protein LOD99_928 [Oopsacas minuta]|uniref:FAM124 domain-containing protein n=1 Tax=Oopsacas minuta TaxID=111878 RepID=A0AAV7K034_9METZ|nr:hypothetical protein LOD99_928 [Oopsacas minuta]
MKDDVPVSKIKDMIEFSSKYAPKIKDYIKLTRAANYTVQGIKMNNFVDETLSKDQDTQTFTQFTSNGLYSSAKQVEHSISISVSHPQKYQSEVIAPLKSRPWHKTFSTDLPFTTPNEFLEYYPVDFYNHNRFTPSWAFYSTSRRKVPQNIMRFVLITNNFLETVYFYQFLLRQEYSYASDKFCTFILEGDDKTQYEFCIKESKSINVKPSSMIGLRIRVKNLEGLKPFLNNKLQAVQHSNLEERTPLWQTMDPDGNNLILEEYEPTLNHPFCFQENSFKKSNEVCEDEDPVNLSFHTVDSGFSEPSISTSDSPIQSLKSEQKRCEKRKIEKMMSNVIDSQRIGRTSMIPSKTSSGNVAYYRVTYV